MPARPDGDSFWYSRHPRTRDQLTAPAAAGAARWRMAEVDRSSETWHAGRLSTRSSPPVYGVLLAYDVTGFSLPLQADLLESFSLLSSHLSFFLFRHRCFLWVSNHCLTVSDNASVKNVAFFMVMTTFSVFYDLGFSPGFYVLKWRQNDGCISFLSFIFFLFPQPFVIHFPTVANLAMWPGPAFSKFPRKILGDFLS